MIFVIVIAVDTVPTPAHANIVRSRWELIDYGNDGTSSDEENIESNVRQKQIHSYKAADPKQLRDIEVLFMNYCHVVVVLSLKLLN